MESSLHSAYNVSFYNIVPSNVDDRDWNAESLMDDKITIRTRLKLKKYLPEIKNQGIQGASLAHAGACMLEFYMRKLQKQPVILSPRFLFENRDSKTQNIMNGRDIMKIMKRYGCCQESSFPSEKPYIELNTAIYKEAEMCKIDGYARVYTIKTLKRCLLKNGPCLISFPVYNHTTKIWKHRKDEHKLGGHAMTIVGYNKKGFLLRNSWGSNWDNNGYTTYPYKDWGCHYEIWTIISEHKFCTTRQMKVFKMFNSFITYLNDTRINRIGEWKRKTSNTPIVHWKPISTAKRISSNKIDDLYVVFPDKTTETITNNSFYQHSQKQEKIMEVVPSMNEEPLIEVEMDDNSEVDEDDS